MQELFESKVFNHTFDFDEWPSTNINITKMLAPYNGSIFDLRQSYETVFPKLFKDDEELKKKKEEDGTSEAGARDKVKVFKIKY